MSHKIFFVSVLRTNNDNIIIHYTSDTLLLLEDILATGLNPFLVDVEFGRRGFAIVTTKGQTIVSAIGIPSGNCRWWKIGVSLETSVWWLAAASLVAGGSNLEGSSLKSFFESLSESVDVVFVQIVKLESDRS